MVVQVLSLSWFQLFDSWLYLDSDQRNQERTSGSSSKTIEVTLRLDEDSDPLPTRLDIASFGQMKELLLNTCGIVNSSHKSIVLVLDRRETIVSLDKIVNLATYDLFFKVKETLVKMYLCKT